MLKSTSAAGLSRSVRHQRRTSQDRCQPQIHELRAKLPRGFEPLRRGDEVTTQRPKKLQSGIVQHGYAKLIWYTR